MVFKYKTLHQRLIIKCLFQRYFAWEKIYWKYLLLCGCTSPEKTHLNITITASVELNAIVDSNLWSLAMIWSNNHNIIQWICTRTTTATPACLPLLAQKLHPKKWCHVKARMLTSHQLLPSVESFLFFIACFNYFVTLVDSGPCCVLW